MIPGIDVLLGGLTGLIGNAFTTWFKYKNAKLEYEHDEKMVNLKTNAMIQQAQMNIQITDAKIKGQIEVADSAAFTESQKTGSEKLFHDKWIDMFMNVEKASKWTGWIYKTLGTLIATAFAFIDWLNSAMRPTLTLYLVGSSSYITYLAWKIMQQHGIETLTSTQAVSIFNQVTSTMIYLAVSAVTWWFGDRTMSKYLQRKGLQKINNPTNGSSITNKSSIAPSGQGGGDVNF